jgi:hypothetical protein
MEVIELFSAVGLSICGPIRWGCPVVESRSGIYVIAQTNQPSQSLCFEVIPAGIHIDKAYEKERWLPSEQIIYIGKADQPISKRISQFYKHQCGNRSPHAGGQILLLLNCDLSVYWAPSPTPLKTEKEMLSLFKSRTGKLPFANHDGQPRPKRVRKH